MLKNPFLFTDQPQIVRFCVKYSSNLELLAKFAIKKIHVEKSLLGLRVSWEG